jgi:hypothetical protein
VSKISIEISKIEIRAFRGIPDLILALNGNSLLLRGENGSGKSSIIDAIELFFTGTVAHLVGTKGLSVQDHAPHVKYGPDDVKICVTFNPGNFRLERTLNSSLSIPNELVSFFKIAESGTFILRRPQLLEFIMSKPADRFRAIGNIIGIERLDQVELELMRLRDDRKGEVESRKREIDSKFMDLSNLLDKKIEKKEDIISPFIGHRLRVFIRIFCLIFLN